MNVRHVNAILATSRYHVVECNGRGKADSETATLKAECEAIIDAELRGQVKVIVTGPEIGAGPFVLFSTGIGDAWLLDPDEQIAMCLVWQGVRVEAAVSEDPLRLELGFDGHYELLSAFFRVESHNEVIGPDGHPNSPAYGHLKLPHLN